MDIFAELAIGELREKQAYNLDEKIKYSKAKIVEFVDRLGGSDKVFVSFSGGKDSTVLLHLCREIYPDIPGVFFNTGLEYPEIVEFTKTIENIEWVKPRKRVNEVWKEYGIPAVSKEQAQYIHDVRNTSGKKLKTKRLNFRGGYHISKRWIFLTDSELTDYEVSHHCCKYFKKLPSDDYVKATGRYPIVGTMAGESNLRLNSWIRHSCNMYDGKKIQSRPLSIWTEDDIWAYIKRYNLDVCELYYKGHNRTGCFLCPFGAHLTKQGLNKFELLHDQHPKQYESLEKLGIKRVLADMNVPIKNDPDYENYRQERQTQIKAWEKRVASDISVNGDKGKYGKYAKYFK